MSDTDGYGTLGHSIGRPASPSAFAESEPKGPPAHSQPVPNITEAENAAGWTLLWDGTGSAIGLECHIPDDPLHPEAKLGHNGDRTSGSLYDLMTAPADKKLMPSGRWNTARNPSQGRHVEFWLNSVRIVESERGSEDFRTNFAASKYRKIPGFGEWQNGHILLKKHGNAVSFRNVKIRNLVGKQTSGRGWTARS